MDTREQFEERLSLNPKAWDLRKVYADWLEDNSEPELAYAQRYMAAEQKCPINYFGSPSWAWSVSDKDWEHPHYVGKPVAAVLLKRVPGAVHYGVKERYGGLVSYRSRQEAEAGLAQALSRLHRQAPKRRRKQRVKP